MNVGRPSVKSNLTRHTTGVNSAMLQAYFMCIIEVMRIWERQVKNEILSFSARFAMRNSTGCRRLIAKAIDGSSKQ